MTRFAIGAKVKRLAIGLALSGSLIGSTLVATAPAHALTNNGGGKTMDALKNDGYKCVRVATNFLECTKDGAPTYWCTDDGACQPAPRRTDGGTVPRNSQAPVVRILAR